MTLLHAAFEVERLISSRNSGKVKCEENWNWRLNAMRDYDIWYVASGSGTITINGQMYPITSGSCFLLGPGDQVAAEQQPEDRLTVLFIHFHTLPHESDLLAGWPRHIQVQDTNWFEIVLNRLLLLDDAPQSDNENKEFEAMLRAALCILARDATSSKHSQQIPLGIRHVIRIIRENASSPPSHSELAQIAGLSQRYLNILFKRYTSLSVKTFIAKARIERASQLLEESALSIGQVAQALGYSDIYSFSKQFKKFTGVSPSQYRTTKAAFNPRA